MRKALIPAFLLVLGSLVLGATVLREPLAQAAGGIPSILVTNDNQHAIPVREQNLDAGGDIKVHEQGTANVAGTVGLSASANAIQQTPADDEFIARLSGSQTHALDHTMNVSLIMVWMDDATQSVRLQLGSRDVLLLPGPAGFQGQHLYALQLTQPLTVSRIEVECAGSCFPLVNINGTVVA